MPPRRHLFYLLSSGPAFRFNECVSCCSLGRVKDRTVFTIYCNQAKLIYRMLGPLLSSADHRSLHLSHQTRATVKTAIGSSPPMEAPRAQIHATLKLSRSNSKVSKFMI